MYLGDLCLHLFCFQQMNATQSIVDEVGGGGVLYKSLGRGVPLGYGNPQPMLDHNQLDFATIF